MNDIAGVKAPPRCAGWQTSREHRARRSSIAVSRMLALLLVLSGHHRVEDVILVYGIRLTVLQDY